MWIRKTKEKIENDKKKQLKIGWIDVSISVLSILLGLFLTFDNGYLLYAYNFLGGLWAIVSPNYYLISYIIMGIMLCISGFKLLKRSPVAPVLYKYTALFSILFAINLFLKEIARCGLNSQLIEPLTIFSLGLILFLYFSGKKFSTYERKIKVNLRLALYAIITIILVELIFSVIWEYSIYPFTLRSIFINN